MQCRIVVAGVGRRADRVATLRRATPADAAAIAAAHVQSHAEGAEARFNVLAANQPAIDFYLAQGARLVGTVMMDDALDHIYALDTCMRRTRAPDPRG